MYWGTADVDSSYTNYFHSSSGTWTECTETQFLEIKQFCLVQAKIERVYPDEENTCYRRQARENACERGMIVYSPVYYWLRKRLVFCWPNKVHCKANPTQLWIPFSIQLKTSLKTFKKNAIPPIQETVHEDEG